MLYLLIYVCMAVMFAQLFRLSQQRGCDALKVGAVNYFIAVLYSIGAYFLRDGEPSTTGIAIGSVNGVFYWLHLLVLLGSFRIAGVGITSAVASMSSITPVIVSFMLWNEPVTPQQWAAVGLMVPTMFLLRPNTKSTPHLTLKGDLLIALNFLLGSAITTIHKAADVYVISLQRPSYNVALFAAATISSAVYLTIKRERVTKAELTIGGVIGLVNATALVLILLSLAALSAAVFYPLGATLIILANIIVSWQLWDERITKRQGVGILFSVLVIVLVNWQ